MPGFEDKIKAVSERVLKRTLSDEEELELFRISEAMGMSDVHSFLYLLLVFKLHEDALKGQIGELGKLETRLNGKFDEIDALYEKIDRTLKTSVEKILGEGARKIGHDIGEHIAEGAKEILGVNGEYHFLRGQTWIVFSVSVLVSAAYWLGSANVLEAPDGSMALDTLMNLPSGWIAFVCGSMYAYMWGWDRWDKVKGSLYYKAGLALIASALVAIAVYLL